MSGNRFLTGRVNVPDDTNRLLKYDRLPYYEKYTDIFMPRLITKRRRPNPKPPCGRKITYVSPHSPFQKLVEAQRLKKDMSISELADRISDATPRENELNPGSLWIWLRNQNGFPHLKSCTRTRLSALARVLAIPLPRLQEALDSSRHIFTAREHREPQRAVNSLERLVAILKNDRRVYVRRTKILNIAESLLAGSRSRS